MIEKEIKLIREKLNKKISSTKEVNQLEFLDFMVSNYDFKHQSWLLKKDIKRRLKSEVYTDNLTSRPSIVSDADPLNITSRRTLVEKPMELFNLTQHPEHNSDLNLTPLLNAHDS